MIKKITIALLLFVSSLVNAQDFSALWEGYFSYYNIIDVTKGEDKIYAAAENAIFSYDVFTNEIETITTVDGLSGETISKIYYSEEFNSLIVGYENGLIEIVFTENNEILSVVDILEKESISPVKKKINHFYEYNGLIYISTDYGISVYDLDRLEFGDTYFIGNGGSQIIVNQTTVFNGFIYAACSDGNGIKKALLENTNLIDYQQWTLINTGNFKAVVNVDDKLYALRFNKTFFEINNDSFTLLYTYGTLPSEVENVENNLLVTTNNNVFVYDNDYNLTVSINESSEFDTNFVFSTIYEDNIYIATEDFGVLKTATMSPSEFVEIRPEGPLKNNAYKIEAGNNELWMTYGDYSLSYNPAPLRRYGISHFIDETWSNIPFDSLQGARNLNSISINPFNPNQVFISSFIDGMLLFNNEVPELLNSTNSGLENIVIPSLPNYSQIRISGSYFDRYGVLWIMSSRVDRPLLSFNPSTNEWKTFSFEEIIPSGLNDELGFSEVVVDGNGTKWVGAFHKGLIGYNENAPGTKIRNVNSLDQNMPSPNTKALAVDSRNQLWIGTIKGLRVLYNTSGFLEDPNPTVNEIVIVEEDGIPAELLSNQYINDIKVDGSDNKWVATLDSGIFYFSPDGQETIYHFTTDNSPLPSNNVTDISIDKENGKVYMATVKGLVSFSAGGSKPQETLEDVFVYPNPVRPEYNLLGSSDLNDINKGVKIKGLTENVNVKITDIEGNLVAEAQSSVNLRSSKANYNFAIDGGTAIWNGKNLANNIVATGVYLILISDLDSFETKVLKLLIVR